MTNLLELKLSLKQKQLLFSIELNLVSLQILANGYAIYDTIKPSGLISTLSLGPQNKNKRERL